MPRRSLRQTAADTPLAQWLVDVAERRGWTSGRQAARYLGINQAAFATWLRGEYAPSLEYQQQLAAKTGEPIDAIAELVAASKPQSEQVKPSTVLATPLTREFAREVVDQLLQILASGERLPVAGAGGGGAAGGGLIRPQIMRIRGEVGLQRGPLVAFEVVGDCLEPRLRPGWIAWVNPEATRRPGDIVLAYVDGEEMFKVFTRDRDTGAEALIALNGRPPIPVDDHVRIEGVVQLVQHAP